SLPTSRVYWIAPGLIFSFQAAIFSARVFGVEILRSPSTGRFSSFDGDPSGADSFQQERLPDRGAKAPDTTANQHFGLPTITRRGTRASIYLRVSGFSSRIPA